mgnify:CR=1 FL=1
MPCHDIHSLEPEYLRRTAQECLARGVFPPRHICVSMAHRNRLFLKREKCLYISLLRDPIARNMSAFFQNLHLLPDEIRTEGDPQKLFEKFKQAYKHSLPVTWFDREFGEQLGINVFDHPFDPGKRYIHIQSENVILFRVDCPDEIKGRVLSRVLGREIRVQRQNDSANKGYATLYNKVKEKARFTPDFVDDIYSTKFSNHFWSREELNEMSSKWKESH